MAQRGAPEIIAWGRVLPETNIATEGTHVGSGDTATPRTFGIIGAYDGHRVGVGRVVVDSTWHHFFDINLIGDPVAPFPKTEGFLASASGQTALSEIKAYYRNIGTWMAHPRRHWSLFIGGALSAMHAQPLAMIVHPKRRYTDFEIAHVGAIAWQHLLRLAPPCTILQVHLGALKQLTRVMIPDPWRPRPPEPDPPYDPALIAQILLGHTIAALGDVRPQIEGSDAEQMERIATEAAKRGLTAGAQALAAGLDRESRALEKITKALAAGLAQENGQLS